jgi:hypothetical protein
MEFREWLDKKHPEFNEGVIAHAVFAALQGLWQYYGGSDVAPQLDQFANTAIQWLVTKFQMAEPQAMMFVKQFLCKTGYC